MTSPDLTKPSPQALAYLLLHEELWPEDFEFDFRNCSTCAMGLAIAYWQIQVPGLQSYITSHDRVKTIAQILGLSLDSAKGVFIYGKFGTSPEGIAEGLKRVVELGYLP